MAKTHHVIIQLGFNLHLETENRSAGKYGGTVAKKFQSPPLLQ